MTEWVAFLHRMFCLIWGQDKIFKNLIFGNVELFDLAKALQGSKEPEEERRSLTRVKGSYKVNRHSYPTVMVCFSGF